MSSPLLVDVEKFKRLALEQEGKPYIWGAKGGTCFDCSGLVTWAIREAGGPDWRMDHNCRALWKKLERTGTPQGDEVALVFYGPPNAPNHVMLALGDGRVFGACGGNRDTVNLLTAARMGAKVRYRPVANYRHDLLGFCRLALAPHLKGPP